MNNRIDDKLGNEQLIDEQSLAGYLKRESEFSQRYQAIDTDEVPAELDQAILLQAVQAANTNSSITKKVVELDRLRKWRRLTLPFAMAATLVLSVSILMRTGDQVPTRVPTTSGSKSTAANSTSVEVQLSNSRPSLVQAPSVEIAAPIESAPVLSTANAPAKVDTALPAPAELKREVDSMSTRTMAAKENRSATVASAATEVSGQLRTPEEKPVSPASRAAIKDAEAQPNRLAATNQATVQRSQSDAASLEEVVTTGVRAERKPPSYGPHSTSTYVPPRQDVGTTEYEKELRESNPSDWLDYIRDLRNAKKSFKANREWKRFVKTYPDYEVAVDDIARGQK